MTVTFSLTESHIQVLRFIVLESPTFILSMPKYDDIPEVAEALKATNGYADDLARLEFLQDVSAEAPIKIADLEKDKGRKHRIFVITRGGISFFRELSNPLVN